MQTSLLPRGTTSKHLRPHARRQNVCVRAGMGEFFKGILDFNSWAPRSSKIWRLNQYAYTEADLINRDADQDSAVNLLESQLKGRQVAGTLGLPESDELAASFSSMDDSQISAALNRRVAMVAQLESPEQAEEEEQALTGQELRDLIYIKYGKRHDLSIVRRDIPGKTLVSLNIMWNHMEQRSFKLTEAQYIEKLDSIAFVVSCIGQAERVRQFMKAPPKAERGLPARPVVGTAVSIRFNLEDAVIKEWFGSGYN